MTDQPEPADRPGAYEPPATNEPAPYEPPASTDHDVYASSATAEPLSEPSATTPEPLPSTGSGPDPAPFTPVEPVSGAATGQAYGDQAFAAPSVPVAQLPGMDSPTYSSGTPDPFSPPPPAASSAGPYSPPPAAGPNPYAQAPGYVAPYPAYTPPQSNGLAVGALVCSLLGFCTCLGSVPGIIMGHLALAKTSRGEAGGRGMAIASLFLGYIVAAMYIGFIVTLIVLGTNGKLGS